MIDVELEALRDKVKNWNPPPGVEFLKPYHRLPELIAKVAPEAKGNEFRWELSYYRRYCIEDLFFLLYFVFNVPLAIHPFWVQAAREVQQGPASHTLDLWAREHGKTTIITIADTIRRILKNPEERICVFSHTKASALGILRDIKYKLESNSMLKLLFPDVLYESPTTEAWKWAEETGLYVKRRGAYKEPTLMASGLIEGMPTGYHFSGRVYDDIETFDMVNTPEIMEKLKEAFDMSQNLGTLDGWHRVIGTPYHHEGLLMYVQGKKDIDGQPIYTVRKKPATEGGEPNGKSVYLPEPKLAELRTNTQHFYSQQLLDPTPRGTQKLNSSYLREVLTTEIPEGLFKFMMVDPAGVRRSDKRVGDSWGIAVIGVEPVRDDVGASNIYILDLVIEPMSESEAIDKVVEVYTRNGRILKLGIEKVGLSTFEIHVANALLSKGRLVTLDNGGLVLLRPAGRSKAQRVEASLSWPLNNGKVHISAAIPTGYRERLKLEMDKFPYWHDDGVDTVSYVYDIMREYRFGARETEAPGEDRWSRHKSKDRGEHSWMIV